jgi:signal transduction histidine kinase
MQVLLDSLLVYSRVITRGKSFGKVNLAEAIQAAISDLEIRIRETGASVEIGDLPAFIEGDDSQVAQLFENLIANALKFHRVGEPPKIRIYSGPPKSEGTPGEVEIYVEDNGIGFEEKYLDRIFLPFQRLHGRSEYEGVGMGLAICRKIVERHGGTITAVSTPGKGSTFIVRLPGIRSQDEG